MTRIPISARLPPGSGALAAHDESIDTVDHLAVAGRRGRTDEPSPNTQRQYDRWLRVFEGWCAERRYQTDLRLSLTDRTAEEFAQWLVVDNDDRPRYTPSTARQALSALRWWAIRQAVHPQPSFNEAWGVVTKYIDDLAKEGIVGHRQDLRIRPGDPIG